MTVAQIKRHLGLEFNARWFFDAIESLEGSGLVKEVGVAPLRWVATEAPKEVKREYILSIGPVGDRTYPTHAMVQRI